MSLKVFKAWNLKRLHARVADIDVLIKISIMDIFPVTYRPAVVFAFLHQVDLIPSLRAMLRDEHGGGKFKILVRKGRTMVLSGFISIGVPLNRVGNASSHRA